MRGLDDALSQYTDTAIQPLLSDDNNRPDGAVVTVGGMITSLSRRIAKTSGNAYARIELEDRSGSIEIMFFGKAYAPIAGVLTEDLICVIKGRMQRRDDGSISISAQELTVPELSMDGTSGPVCVALPEHRATEATIRQIGEVLRNHRGESEVRIHLDTHRCLQVLRLGPEHRVNPTPALFGDLKVLLGPACLEA